MRIDDFIQFERSQIKTIRGGQLYYDVKGHYKYLTLLELWEYFFNKP